MGNTTLIKYNKKSRVWDNSPFATKKATDFFRCFLHGCDGLAKMELLN